MVDFLLSIEELEFAAWMRESSSLFAFPGFLWVHTLAMSVIAGSSAIISFALLGVWPKGTPIKPLEKFYPILWSGVAVSAITGVGIFVKDASSYGRNWDFYLKLVFVLIGVWLLVLIRNRIFRNPQVDNGPLPSQAKLLAWGSLLCWFVAIVAGRLIAYLNPLPGGF